MQDNIINVFGLEHQNTEYFFKFCDSFRMFEDIIEQEDNIISLLDENGVESQFEVILTLEAENKEYAILMPVDDEEAEEALVFRIDQDEEGEMLVPLEDDKEYEIVVDVYNTLMDEEGLNDDEC